MNNEHITEEQFKDSCRSVSTEIDTIVLFLQEEMKDKVFNTDEKGFNDLKIQNKYLNKLAQRIKNEALENNGENING